MACERSRQPSSKMVLMRMTLQGTSQIPLEICREKTKVIGITAMNTNGLTYCDQTFTALIGFGSDSYNSYKFRSLMFDKTLRNTTAPKILAGPVPASAGRVLPEIL